VQRSIPVWSAPRLEASVERLEVLPILAGVALKVLLVLLLKVWLRSWD
jgi:hypothetical protein